MIPRKARLPLHTFPKKEPVARRTPLFVVKKRANGLGYDRFGVVVSSQQEPRSVGRHRIKRLILARAVKAPPSGTDYLFIATAPTKEFTRNRLEKSFQNLP